MSGREKRPHLRQPQSRTCRKAGINIGSMDLVVATIAFHHDAELITLDTGFKAVATVSPLKANVLSKPPA